MPTIYDIVSLSIIPIMLYPFFIDRDTYLQVGAIVAILLHFLIKMVTGSICPNICKRPDGARDCGLLNNGGLVDTQSGFPSGHVTSISYLFTYLLLKKKHYDTFDILLYILPSFAMGISRYMRGCHTIIQIVAGYLLGVTVANIVIHKKDIDTTSEDM